MSDDSLYVVHGGSDFDKINPSRFGSGEPGGIRPLGKGLYSFVIDHEDPKRAAYAIDYAKHYSKKYGYGDKAVHVFKIPKSISTSWNGDNDDNTKFPRYPRKIEGLGGYPEKELAEYRAIDDKYKAVKGTPEEGDSWLYSNRAYERLKQAADVQFQHLPIGLTEASIHNPEVATRIGKFDLDTPTEDILGMVKNDAANVPHKDNGGGITAYQGGPHSVGEEGYQDDKIGTGEGAQSFGHGHYFAESEPIAKYYRDKLSVGDDIEIGGHQYSPLSLISYKENPQLIDNDINLHREFIDKLSGLYRDPLDVEKYSKTPMKDIERLENLKKHPIPEINVGHMHEVSINAHPDHFLDWDKPLSEQSDHVQNAFNSHKDLIHSNPYLDTFFDNIVEHRDGAEIYNELSHKNAVGLGDKGASNFLSSMGIHGIKYLDANSRSKGEGTRNYVVFDPKRVDIKRRYEQGGEVNDDGITAYHSSPHDFDEFDTAKIGTGEGNQMYGHGLYFAENPEVSGQGGRYYNQFMNEMESSPERHATVALWANKFDRDKAIASLDRSHAYHSDQAIPSRYGNGPDAEEGDRLLAKEYKEGADYLRSGKIAGPRTYEVSINAHQDHMLDWDKTIDEQSDYVKNALNKTEWWPWTKERIEDRSGRHGANPQGRHVYNDLSEDYSLEEATNFLQDAGIKGVRYLDAGSRDSGKGTHNYVVFDHKNVDVKRKYEQGGEVLAHDDPRRDENLGKFLQNSRVRNGEGDHVVLYHITPKDFDTFKAGGDDPELSGPGIWLSPNKHHLPAAHNVGGGSKGYDTGTNVMPVYANIKSPLVLDTRDMIDWAKTSYGAGSEFPLYLRPEVKQKLIEDGYDGIFYAGGRGVEYGTNGIGVGEQPNSEEEVIAFHPHQIKSAIGNNGDFDPSKPSINEARGGRIGYDYGGDVRTGDNPGGAADANRSREAFRDANRNYNAGSGTQTAGPSGGNRPDNRPDNSNDRFNIGGGGAPMPPQRGNDSYFGNMGGNIGSILGGLAFGPLGSIGGRYLGNQFNQPDNSRFEAKNDEFGNPIGNNSGWLDFLGNSGNPPAPITSDNRRDPIKRKRRILMPDGTYQEVEEGMKSGGVAKSYNQVHNSKIVEHALSKVGVSLHVHRPPS